MDITTEDGHVVHHGDRVYNYYDCRWGTIASEPDSGGWFTFQPADGSQRQTLNGERICTAEPRWAR